MTTYTDIIQALQRRADDEQDKSARLAERMNQNQKLATAEERLSDGFQLIYNDLQTAKRRVRRLREAISALRDL